MVVIVGTIHVIACVLLVITVLLQSGKGGGIAGAFGGQGTQAVFGGRGAATFLSQATTVLAVVFMLTSLGMTVLGGTQTRKSALAEQAKKEGVAAPFTPGGAPEMPGGASTEGSQPTQGVMPGTDAQPVGGSPGATPPTGAAETPAGTPAGGGAAATPPGGGN